MSNPLDALTDDELEASLRNLARNERRNLIEILRHLQAMDKRRLAERRAYPSLFEYCTKELRWAEGEVAKRIQVARTAVRIPRLLSAVRRGLLTLSTAALLAPHVDRQNCSRVLRSAYGRRTRDVERIVAAISPQPEPKEKIRFLGLSVSAPEGLEPAATPHQGESSARREEQPLFPESSAPQRVHFSFTADERLLAQVERAKELLMGKYPDPGYENVFAEGVGALLARLDPDRREGKERSSSGPLPGKARTRVPPAWVKRTVWRRDRGYCAFKSVGGRRCQSKAGLQYDHIVPWALGGRSDDPANIRLLCRAHNRLEARRCLGDGVVDAALAASRERGERRRS